MRYPTEGLNVQRINAKSLLNPQQTSCRTKLCRQIYSRSCEWHVGVLMKCNRGRNGRPYLYLLRSRFSNQLRSANVGADVIGMHSYTRDAAINDLRKIYGTSLKKTYKCPSFTKQLTALKKPFHIGFSYKSALRFMFSKVYFRTLMKILI
uniref:EF-hand domain-containing protein n=1 Tax=Parascaris univalens TaxID=6257 RepID=A0A915BW89_PARUN